MKDFETLIKKAIEGGYKDYTETSGSSTKKYHSDILFDPLFFQALGKACGWEYTQDKLKIEAIDPNEREQIAKEWNIKPDWKIYALRFHEINLTEGFDKAVEWLTNLVKE